MPSIWANFDHVFEVFQGLFFAFLLWRKDALGTRLYIYHDPKANTFSIEIDENTDEIQDFISGILLINARLRIEDLSEKERKELIKKKKMKINELRWRYGVKEATDMLDSRLSRREKLEIEDEIVRIQGNLNQNRDDYYYAFNEDTQEFELRLEQNRQIVEQIVSAVLKLNNKVESKSTSAADRRGMVNVRDKFIRHLRKLGAHTLADI